MQTTKKLVAFNFISVTFYIIFLIFSKFNFDVHNNIFRNISYVFFLTCIIITAIMAVEEYKHNRNHEVILLALTCVSAYIGEIYIYLLNSSLNQRWLNIAYVVYAIACISFFIGTMFILKEAKYIRFIINIFTEIIIVFINVAFVVWYIICSKKINIYYVYYLYLLFDYVMVGIVFSAFNYYEKEKEEDSKTEYQVFFSKRIWITFILSILIVFVIAFFDYNGYNIMSKNGQLKAVLFTIIILVTLRECFSFFGFKNLVSDLEQKIKFTDMLLQYNVNISKDLKKNIDDKKQEIELAKKIQQALIPNKATIVSDTFTIRSKLISARDMSGDYYDYFSNSDLVVWVVADVMGKGMKAAMLASNLRTCLKMLLDDIEYKDDIDPAELLEQVNVFMYDDLAKIGAYITMVIGVFNIKSNKLRVSSAGHVPPMYISEDGIKKVELKATAIGLKSTTVYNTVTLDLKSGENIVFYTDGVWDVKDDNKQRLGSKKFNEVLYDVKDENLDIADRLIENLDKYKGKNDFCDDVTVSVLSMV